MKDSTDIHKLKSNFQKGFQDNREGDFNKFAKKLRLEKFDKNTILQYKSEAINHEKMKKKKNKSIISIQKIMRGFLSRKKFKNILYYIITLEIE